MCFTQVPENETVCTYKLMVFKMSMARNTDINNPVTLNVR